LTQSLNEKIFNPKDRVFEEIFSHFEIAWGMPIITGELLTQSLLEQTANSLKEDIYFKSNYCNSLCLTKFHEKLSIERKNIFESNSLQF
jgi:hypothetical protein